MEYNKFISDMAIGDTIEGFYILSSAINKTTQSGKPFLAGTITDRTGKIEIKFWDYPGPITSADNGKIVKVRGEVSEYNGLQLNISKMRFANESDVFDKSLLVPQAPIDESEALDYIKDILMTVRDVDYRCVAETMLHRHLDAFSKIPAAKSVHHGFISGLLMHTSNMVKIADFLSGMYPVLNRDLLITGTLLHDFAKEKEFAFSELGLVTDYTTKGELLGHLVMGACEIGEVCRENGIPEDKEMLLQHMILSHHGEPEYGAAVKPQIAEAELLYLIDSVDSKMEIYGESLAEIENGQFTQKIFALDKKIYKHE